MLSPAMKRAGVWTLAGCLCVCAGTASSAQAGVRWRSSPEAQVEKMGRPALERALTEAVALGRGEQAKSHFVATFDGPVTPEQRDALKAAGVSLLNYVGDHTYFVRIDGGTLNAANAAAAASLRNVRPIQNDWKLHPDFVAGKIQPWSVVDMGAPADADNPVVAAYVMFHEDVDLDREGLALVTKHGAQVVSMLDPINGMVIELNRDSVKPLASEDAVMWIEPPLPKFEELNFENRIITGANTAQAAPYNLTGAGVTVLVYDGGTIRTTHLDFQGRATNIDTDAVSDHATHVSATVGGAGIADANERGMAPGVTLVNAGFESDGSSDFLYQDPGDMLADYTNAVNNFGADISNNSIGNNTEPNGFDCSWQGDYGATDVLIDSIVRGTALGQPFRVVWAAGNERQGSRCDVEGFGDYYSSGPPANAKNQISVGALNSNDDSMTTFSSWGPSDDGRLRPDVSAPGCESGGDGGVRSAGSASDTTYTVKCGTSMASPTVCGLSALLLQDFRAQYPSEPDPRNSTLKAIWMHTAQDILNPGPDYQTGYGSVRVVPAIEQIRSGNFFEAEVGQGGVYTATVVVQAGQSLKVTIAWDDVPGTPNVNPTLVNDLDLIVTGPGGQQFFPWTLNPANPSANAVRTQRNSRDNNEQVLIENPAAGAYLVEVRGFNVPQGPQTFSLVASPFLVNCSSQGVASLDRNQYNCASLANIRVVDCDLNLDDGAIDTVTVNIASTSDATGFPVVLTEVAAEAATFTGSVQLSDTVGPSSLLVASGDTVTLTYQDADNGSGSPATVTSTATVDCTGPMISGVMAQNLQPLSAQIVFTTSEPAQAVIRYGSSCGSLTQTFTLSGFNTTHTANLTGLTDGTSYFYTVEATDASGNFALANNGGFCFTFATPDIPDYFTELFTTTDANDIDFKSVVFAPNGSFQFYTACADPIVALPTDPTTGTPVTLPDDSPALTIDLTGGQTVKLYGQSYSRIFVNPNGNITFDAGDSDTTESLTDQFERPRVSACFDDLNPTLGGTVTWQQLSDRLVVSFVNVREDSTTIIRTATFQYEFFFDGRIALNYLDNQILDGLMGISSGPGPTPNPFIESNFTNYGSCGPRPPIAQGASLATPLGELIPITLFGSDDGLPQPPASIRYIVTSLPAHGRLFDGAMGQITNVPHELSGGSMVNYDPFCSYIGNDSFTFIVNDFGTPPEGGDSNTATVSITVGGPTTIYSVDLDTNPNWTMEGQWAFGVPTGGGGSSGGGSGSPDPTAGFTGANVLGFNLAGNYTNNMPMYRLTSTPFDLSRRSGVRVEFQRWLGIENSIYDDATFEVSTDGFTYTPVWVHSTGSLNPNSQWTLQSYDISAIADGQSTVYLRWTIGPTDSSVIYCGWNIDDIKIKANVPPPPCPNDLNGDCEVNFSDIAFILANWGTYDFNDVAVTLAAWGQSCNN